MSQVRGPKAARIYAEAVREHEREQVRRQDRTGSKPASEARASDDSAAAENAEAADKARTFSPNPYDSAASSAAAAAAALPPRQEVLVLRDGFQNWQGLYRVGLFLLSGSAGCYSGRFKHADRLCALPSSLPFLPHSVARQKDPELVENFDVRIWQEYAP